MIKFNKSMPSSLQNKKGEDKKTVSPENKNSDPKKTNDGLPSYEESMNDKVKEEEQKANSEPGPYVKFPHPVNRHNVSNNRINTQFPGNTTLTYLNASSKNNTK